MKTVAIIQARMGSTRLPDKVLMPVLGKPILGWMLDRLATCSDLNEVIVATTTNVRDDVIADLAVTMGYKVYRGSEDDVLDRYYQAAITVKPDVVVRLTADCPLLDTKILQSMVRRFARDNLDFLSNSEPLPSSWPDGMDVSIIRFDALKRAWVEALKPSEREHVTFYFWNNPLSFRCERIEHKLDWSKYRFTLDYPEDFEVLKAIIEYFGKENPTLVNNISMEDIVRFIDSNPPLFQLNEKYTRGLGWLPSLQRDLECL